ncbi:two component transcriptional regulator, LytTR family [Lishizhenia tianjinensis]|uniref:Two component transcriptional regulator, LytTR family n=1 Tax=Lishizhenia tianjinensis TaxID=477690 RepID=A0A1I7B4P9_9FLAO|nr:response regulator transcription factor [Lishizhenia tianjinensis]SFT82122.1 two component transcriptional regulator, LytTR family [Lishizhenia tianjinensis]
MKTTLNLLVVEDETIIAENLKRILINLGFPNIYIANNYDEGVFLFDKEQIHIALVDINLGSQSKTGIELAQYMNENGKVAIVYITANSDMHTLDKAKITRPTSYLLKPFDRKVIQSTLEILVYNEFSSVEKIKLKDQSGTTLIDPQIIDYIKSDGGYLEIFTPEKRYVYRDTLKNILELLPETFVQVHKSFLVNKSKISKVKGTYIEINQEEIPLGRNYKTNIF